MMYSCFLKDPINDKTECWVRGTTEPKIRFPLALVQIVNRYSILIKQISHKYQWYIRSIMQWLTFCYYVSDYSNYPCERGAIRSSQRTRGGKLATLSRQCYILNWHPACPADMLTVILLEKTWFFLPSFYNYCYD